MSHGWGRLPLRLPSLCSRGSSPHSPWKEGKQVLHRKAVFTGPAPFPPVRLVRKHVPHAPETVNSLRLRAPYVAPTFCRVLVSHTPRNGEKGSQSPKFSVQLSQTLVGRETGIDILGPKTFSFIPGILVKCMLFAESHACNW